MVGSVVELYYALLSFSKQGETTICHLHKPCNDHPMCSTTSTTPVIDFDNDYCDEDEISFYWQYKCSKCNKNFYITKWYKLVDTAIKTQEEYEEE